MTDHNNITDQNEHLDLLYAYSLGCLDEEELSELNEYLQARNEFPWQELGEYQNLAALLPSILNMETPSRELKDKVARKLYRIKNERRPKKTSESITREQTESEIKQSIPTGEKTVLSGFFEHPKSLNDTENREDNIIQKSGQQEQDTHTDQPQDADSKADEISVPDTLDKVHADDNDYYEADEIDTIGIGENESPADQQSADITVNKKPYKLHGITEPETEKKSRAGIILVIILFIIASIGGVYLYQKFSSDVDLYKTGISKLNKQVSDLNEQIAVNKEVQKILQMKDVHIINLYGSSINKEASGKVIISFESSNGFLQLSNMPVLNNEKLYQLWMSTEGKTTSLGVFKPIDSTYYFPVLLPVQNYKSGIRFFITEESSKDSTKPSEKIYLTGTLQ